MTSQSISVSPDNSIVFIADPSCSFDVPGDTAAALITTTSTCIAVGTLAQMDGNTSITIGDVDTKPIGKLAFRGVLKTPGHKVAVLMVPGVVALEICVPNDDTNIDIWVNDLSEPDRIIVITS